MPKAGAEQETIYEGIPASPGIAIAPVHVVARGFSAPEVYEIAESEVEREQERFRQALEITKRQLIELQSRLEDLSGDNESGIFEAHVMILEDRSVVDRVLLAIAKRQQNAEYAFYAVMQNFLEAMRRIPDPYLRERTADIEDVAQRVLRNFSTEGDARPQGPDGQHVLVAYDLAPSDTASMNRRQRVGIRHRAGQRELAHRHSRPRLRHPGGRRPGRRGDRHHRPDALDSRRLHRETDSPSRPRKPSSATAA